jgi:hypothetical protein
VDVALDLLVARPGGGATITAAAPSAIASPVSAAILASPALLTPTTTGSSPATCCRVRCTTRRASSGVSLGASPIIPSTVMPWTPVST